MIHHTSYSLYQNYPSSLSAALLGITIGVAMYIQVFNLCVLILLFFFLLSLFFYNVNGYRKRVQLFFWSTGYLAYTFCNSVSSVCGIIFYVTLNQLMHYLVLSLLFTSINTDYQGSLLCLCVTLCYHYYLFAMITLSFYHFNNPKPLVSLFIPFVLIIHSLFIKDRSNASTYKNILWPLYNENYKTHSVIPFPLCHENSKTHRVIPFLLCHPQSKIHRVILFPLCNEDRSNASAYKSILWTLYGEKYKTHSVISFPLCHENSKTHSVTPFLLCHQKSKIHSVILFPRYSEDRSNASDYNMFFYLSLCYLVSMFRSMILSMNIRKKISFSVEHYNSYETIRTVLTSSVILLLLRFSALINSLKSIIVYFIISLTVYYSHIIYILPYSNYLENINIYNYFINFDFVKNRNFFFMVYLVVFVLLAKSLKHYAFYKNSSQNIILMLNKKWSKNIFIRKNIYFIIISLLSNMIINIRL